MEAVQSNPLLDYEPTSIEGKAVVITGGTTGIGRATALALAGAGARVLIFGRNQRELDQALEAIDEIDGEGYGLTGDTSNDDDIANVFNEADKVLGGIDILVNNAALGAESIAENDPKKIRYVVETNLLGYMLCAKEAIARMEKRGGGHIVNIGSMSADVREEGSSVYVATKAGIQGFSETLRKEVNEKGIKVSLIEPGLTGTDMTREKANDTEQRAKQEEGTMMKAEDIAACVLYCLTQPARCDVVEVRIRPHLQKI